MIRDMKSESLFLKTIVNMRICYIRSILWVRGIYGKSMISNVRNRISNKMKVWFGSSITRDIFRVREKPLAVDDSVLVDIGFKLFYRVRRAAGVFLRSSRTSAIILKAKDCIALDPVNRIGAIILIAVMTNIVISLFMARGFGFVAWFMRINTMLIGVLLISCGSGWDELKKTSLCCRLIKKRSR